jgi:hypothetical protein
MPIFGKLSTPQMTLSSLKQAIVVNRRHSRWLFFLTFSAAASNKNYMRVVRYEWRCFTSIA